MHKPVSEKGAVAVVFGAAKFSREGVAVAVVVKPAAVEAGVPSANPVPVNKITFQS